MFYRSARIRFKLRPRCGISAQDLKSDINLPHAEWFFEPAKIPPNNALCFRPAPALRYVTVTVPEADRMVLWAGYHRSYGWAANNRGEGMDCRRLWLWLKT